MLAFELQVLSSGLKRNQAMLTSRFIEAIDRVFCHLTGLTAQTGAIQSSGYGNGEQRIVAVDRLRGTRTRAAERLRQEMQLLEELKSKGDLISFRAAEQRIIWQELMDLERETVWMEFDDTIDRITSISPTVARDGKETAQP